MMDQPAPVQPGASVGLKVIGVKLQTPCATGYSTLQSQWQHGAESTQPYIYIYT